MAVAKHKYLMDYIDDKDLYKAVKFAAKMIRDGRTPSNAVRISSNYYGVDMRDISHYLGQRGGRKASEKY